MYIKKLLLSIILVFIFFACSGPGGDTAEECEFCHYIRAGAAGKNNGSDWDNAWTQLPDNLERGHTYYIAEGNYPAYTFDDAEAGETQICIKKAVSSNHGTESGWVAAFGDGQAVFSASSGEDYVIAFFTGYWSVDGQTGGDKDNYGFKFQASGDVKFVVLVQDRTWSNTVIEHIDISYSEIQHRGTDVNYEDTVISGRGFQVHSQAALQNSSLSHCYIHDIPGISIYFCNETRYNLIEYCIVSRNHSDPDLHGEGIQSTDNCNDNIVRYTFWEDIEGTAVIVARDRWQIYGNVFYYTTDYPHAGQSGSGISMGIFYGHSDNKIYNNSSYGLTGINGSFFFTNNPTGNQVYNNMWADVARIRFVGQNTDMSHNSLFNCPDYGFMDSITDNNFHYGTENPFLNPGDYDFRLKTPTNPGITLTEPYNVDLLHNLRGADSHPDRGAYEYIE